MSLHSLHSRALEPYDRLAFVSYPAEYTGHIWLAPEDAFGVPCLERTTQKEGQLGKVVVDANTGTTAVKGGLIDRVQLELSLPDADFRLDANRLTVRSKVGRQEEAHALSRSLSNLLPLLLSARLNVPVAVHRFLVALNAERFSFVLANVRHRTMVSTSAANADHVAEALKDWSQAGRGHERFVAALAYYRRAQRLAAMQPIPANWFPEATLNLAKCIEVLLTADRDRLRQTAAEWGLPESLIESYVVPVLLVRSQLDVAHVSLAPLPPGTRDALVDFTLAALDNVRELLGTIWRLLKAGEIQLRPPSIQHEKRTRDLLSRLSSYPRKALKIPPGLLRPAKHANWPKEWPEAPE
ncbi:hypothetical protein ACFL59_01240 [Planctomycetota bacterium]